jgi:histone deacetylase 1/2
MDDPDEDLIPRDTRRSTSMLDSLVQPEGELSDSEDEGEGGRRNVASHRDATEPTETASTASGAEPMQTDSESPVTATVTTAKAPTGILGSAGGAIAPGAAGTVTHETAIEGLASSMQVDPDEPPTEQR